MTSRLTRYTLLAAREQIVETITGAMPAAHREFLVGFKKGTPDWEKLGLPDAAELPAVKFKQINLDKLPREVRAKHVDSLSKVLGIEDGRG
ncbi:hypothetical protein SAMN05216228_10839 [Rhizobium tibeticum]|uniref:Uncharacterized protein n=1 Tax=Rhizobium tibeticum TaxID=501024 RepID=A0A1H8WWX9_9HYPH|nr:hypothetical protein [Rhizobium tibeticum]SEI21797.1 hypothetical protein RTCCBAU85039_6729 [Rhizobium tibeticum]SEP32119.1 hypothetical protein SAMN05216228_10839 [Rhizobium tibeticum]